ncbi:uncharacterized protein LOC135702313 [Ochlerotatus camptorhynchus]|uniref:uncharacterized protein LOC135702313 n=1 Tax=Ochlerotatus camptorhynchus TaxID=644619 RepID=UPI0031D3F570
MDKFTYLRTSLIGGALQEIASIEISSANYPIAWTALENAFENKKLLVMTHLDSLFALEPLRQENYESLSKLVNGFEKNLQRLSKIGENPEGWSTLLHIDIRSWNIPKEIILADPTFNESGAVDLIIGAEVYLELMIAERQIKLGDTGPTLQNTLLGWIVSGGSPEVSTSLTTVSSCATENIEEGLARFFELESCRTTSTLSLEESACELHFEKTTTRDSSGRFVVQLPKKQFMLDRLGESQSIAIRRFMALERRLDADPAVKKMYTEFIEEYLRMQHMREISPRELSTFPVAYFLPHHAVIKPDSTTTKLRVVFDASCATTTRVSLNDVLMVGPVVQEDLNSITLRFRLRKYTITADVEKMYRMMKTHRLDHPLHCIVWRADSGKPLRIFVLTTVTYGTSSAPYLATRCLKKLAEEEKGNFPAAADTIIYDFYVDDMLKSVDSIEEGVQLSKDLIHVLGTAGLTLRKWSSNSREIMDSIPPYLRDERSSLDLEPSNFIVKTLGLKWEPRSDVFRFTVPQWNPATELNKRIILSDFAKLFDPLGLVGPTLVQAKVFLQDLWRTKCSWNDTLPEELQNWWREFREGLAGLRLLQVPRWVAFGSDTISAELHMFCDASKKAYGACIYLRCTSFNGSVTALLLTAKSRVAPLEDLEKKRKQTSIPRLELSSALTGVHLFEKVVQSIKITAQPYFWTDSMIVKFSFVANRVSEIQHISRGGIWNHIAGLENPADVLSRGMTPDILKDYQMWWHGPSWLRQDKTSWPTTATITTEHLDPSLLEEKTTVSAAAQVIETSPVFGLRSSLNDLLRLVALIRRFAHNCKNRLDRRVGFIRYEEREEALRQLLALAQQESFPEDLAELQKNGEVKSTSMINQLTPRFVNGLILVGSRLANANISAGRKHPIVLDNQHPLSVLIATDYHRKHLHAGQQLLTASMRERYWPIAVRNLARMVIHRCVKCFRARPKLHEQLMADLPSERVTPAPPFLRVGVDYCGPFYIQYPYRKGAPIKCFVAVFVCLVVKAVHLEVVGDLTSQAFIAALRRFVARRGRPEILMCDNATNFIGARRELGELRKLFNNQEFAKTVAEETAMDNINFKFIPAKSPNFGGLWEAAVKSMKGHLKRTLGNMVISSDEMATLVAQIEACLNSRPITPLSNDPNDMEILTPGHFLVGRPLTEIPEPSLEDLNQTRLSRWQRVQNFLQHIWKRWSTQYLSDLQARTKWTRQRNNVSIGTMVLLCEDNTPPLKWRMGRVVEIHPGKDGNIRVVKVRTKDGEFLRAISKICILPIRDNEATATSALGKD